MTLDQIQTYLQTNYPDNTFPLDDAFLGNLGVQPFWTAAFGQMQISFTGATGKIRKSGRELVYKGAVASFMNTAFPQGSATIIFWLSSKGVTKFRLKLYLPDDWNFSDSFTALPQSLDYTTGMPQPVDNFLAQSTFTGVKFTISSSSWQSKKFPGMHPLNKYLNISGTLQLTGPFAQVQPMAGTSSLPFAGYVNLNDSYLYLSAPLTGITQTFSTSTLQISSVFLGISSSFGSNYSPYQNFGLACNLAYGSNTFDLFSPLLIGAADFAILEAGIDIKQSAFSYASLQDMVSPLGISSNPQSLLPSSLSGNLQQDPSVLLAGFTFCIRPSDWTLLYVKLKATLSVDWSLIANYITLESLYLDLLITNPLNAPGIDSSLAAGIGGNFRLGGTAGPLFIAGTSYPGWLTYCKLAPGSSIDLQSIFSYFDLDLSDIGITDLTCKSMDITIDPTDPSGNAYALFIDLEGNWNFLDIGSTSLNMTGLTLSCDLGISPVGFSVTATFQVSEYQFVISGAYAEDNGWTFSGSLEQGSIDLGQFLGDIAGAFGQTLQLPASFPQMELSNITVSFNTQSQVFNFQGTVSVSGLSIGNISFDPIGLTINGNADPLVSIYAMINIAGNQLQLTADSDFNFSGSLTIPGKVSISMNDLTSAVYGKTYQTDNSGKSIADSITFTNTSIAAAYSYPLQTFRFNALSDVTIPNPFSLKNAISFGQLNVTVNYDGVSPINNLVSITGNVGYADSATTYNFGQAFLYFPDKKSVFGFSMDLSSFSSSHLLSQLLDVKLPSSVTDFAPALSSPAGSSTRVYMTSGSDTITIPGAAAPFLPGFNVDQLVLNVMNTNFLLSANIQQSGFTMTANCGQINLGFVTITAPGAYENMLAGPWGPQLTISSSKGGSISLSGNVVFFPETNSPVCASLSFAYSQPDGDKVFTGTISDNAGLSCAIEWSEQNGFSMNGWNPLDLIPEFPVDLDALSEQLQNFLNGASCQDTCGEIMDLLIDDEVNAAFQDINISFDSYSAAANTITFNIGVSLQFTVGDVKAGLFVLDPAAITIAIPQSFGDLGTSILSLFTGENMSNVIDALFTTTNAKALAQLLATIGAIELGESAACMAICKLGDLLVDAAIDAAAAAAAEGAAGVAAAAGAAGFLQFASDIKIKDPGKQIPPLLQVYGASAVANTSTNQLTVTWDYTDPNISGGEISFTILVNGTDSYTASASPFQVALDPSWNMNEQLPVSITENYTFENKTYSSATVTTSAGSALPAPTNLTLTFDWTTAQFTVSWDVVSGAGSYDVCLMLNDVCVSSNTVNASPATIGLPPDIFSSGNSSPAAPYVTVGASGSANNYASTVPFNLNETITSQMLAQLAVFASVPASLQDALTALTNLSTLNAQILAFAGNSNFSAPVMQQQQLAAQANAAVVSWLEIPGLNCTYTVDAQNNVSVQLSWQDCSAESIPASVGLIQFIATVGGQSITTADRSILSCTINIGQYESGALYEAIVQTQLTPAGQPALYTSAPVTQTFTLPLQAPEVTCSFDYAGGNLLISWPPAAFDMNPMPVNAYTIEVYDSSSQAVLATYTNSGDSTTPPANSLTLPLSDENFNLLSAYNSSDTYQVNVIAVAAVAALSSPPGSSAPFTLGTFVTGMGLKQNAMMLVSTNPLTQDEANTLVFSISSAIRGITDFCDANPGADFTEVLSLLNSKMAAASSISQLTNNLTIATFTATMYPNTDGSPGCYVQCCWSDCTLVTTGGTDYALFVLAAVNSEGLTMVPSYGDPLRFERNNFPHRNAQGLYYENIYFNTARMKGTWTFSMYVSYRNTLFPSLNTDGPVITAPPIDMDSVS